ncbi:hypothetical protein [Rhizobium sp. CSW-27]|uniref:hypothetical protein n=1 Tax=Rhizobium sp. CSW-27 TaxID=2839985 RepID=UPI001C01C84E|nr:hypothetical protein [Rhizobium sp. CSW-27]MBT9369622.1 hypothetical protein [Rhizobium sp. CSW-27]
MRHVMAGTLTTILRLSGKYPEWRRLALAETIKLALHTFISITGLSCMTPQPDLPFSPLFAATGWPTSGNSRADRALAAAHGKTRAVAFPVWLSASLQGDVP